MWRAAVIDLNIPAFAKRVYETPQNTLIRITGDPAKIRTTHHLHICENIID
jgi:hypothetical protein